MSQVVWQAVGLVPDDRSNGAQPMETDAGNSSSQRKRRRISNHVYVGSTDLGCCRKDMEVKMVSHASTNAYAYQ